MQLRVKHFLEQHRSFLIVLLLHLVLSSTYASLTPLGEAPDEAAHLSYARFMAKNRRLPANLQERDAAGYRSTWPPLYHFLVAVPVAMVGNEPPTRLKSVGDTPRRLIPTNGQTIAAFIHTADEAWPWRGLTLSWHLGRFISVILVALSVCTTYAVAWRLTGQRLLATGTAALHAFLPQALFIGSVINDDNLLIFLSGLIFLTLIHYTQRPTPPGLLQFFILGTLLGLATVAKYNALPLWFLSFIWTIWQTYTRSGRDQSPTTQTANIREHGPSQSTGPGGAPPLPRSPAPLLALTHLLTLIAGAALTCGWWFAFSWRNFNQINTLGLIQGSLAALSAGTADASLRQLAGDSTAITVPPSTVWLEWVKLLFQSFWGLFGGGSTIELPGWIYGLLALICLIALNPFIWLLVSNFKFYGLRLGHQPSRTIDQITPPLPAAPCLLIPLLYLPLPLLRFLLSNRLVETAQGRHLFPALPFIALGLVAGLSILVAHAPYVSNPNSKIQTLKSKLPLLLPAFTLILSIYSLNLILASYPPPLPLHTTGETVTIDNQLNINLTEEITLLGYEIGQPTTGLLPVALLWHTGSIPAEDYLIALTLADSSGQIIGNWLGHPIGGRYPTRAWDPGDFIRDTIPLPLIPGHPATNATLTLTLLNTAGQPTADPVTLTTNLPLPPAPQLPSSPAQTRADNLSPAAPFTYRSTLSFALPGQGSPPSLIAPSGQVFTPLRFISGPTGSIAHFIVAPNWPGGNYQSPINNYQVRITNRHIQLSPPPMSHPLEANFANQITLLGYDLPERRVEPGQSFPITLHLRAERTLGQDLVIFNHLLDQNAVQRGGADRIPQQYYTTLLWVPGEIVSDAYEVPVDANAPAGIYWLDLGLYPADNPQSSWPLFVNGQPIERRSVAIGPFKVGGPPPGVIVTRARPQTPLNLSFADQVMLLGFELLDPDGIPITAPNPTPEIQTLKLYWQPITRLDVDYTVFVHILDLDGNLVAQADSPPAAGAYPTSLWDPGEVIADGHPFPDLSTGRYTVHVGLYRPDTGERLPLAGSPEGSALLVEFEVSR